MEIHPAAQAVAAWWSKYLTGVAPQNNGDDSETGGFAAALMLLVSAQDRHTPEQAAAFERELALMLSKEIEGRPERLWLSVGTDYHPDGTLQEAATRAGFVLGGMALPIKSSSFISRDQDDPSKIKASVKQGYGAQLEVIWEG